MRKVILLFSILLCCCMVVKSSQIDKKYLEGGIPNVLGSVVFQKKIPNETKATQKDLYQNLLLWVKSKTEKSDKDLLNSVLYENSDAFELAARLQTKLVFKNEGIILDDAIMQYVLKIKVYDDFVEVTIQNIGYDYYEEELKKDLRIKSTWIPAEKIISDDVSMNKQKNRLFKPYDKFRMFTIDEIENIYSQISTCIENTKTLENISEAKNDDGKIVLIPSTIETESIIVDNQSIESTSEIGAAELIYKDENVLIIAGNKDGFCIETPISYSLEKIGNIIDVYIQLEETSCVSKMIETGIYTLVIYKDEYEPLLTSMSNQKKFTLDTFQKLGLQPIELPSKNIGLENTKICMTVEANPERTRIVRQKKKSNKIFVGKIFEKIP